MSADPSMDLKELLPLAGRDAFHEYPRRTLIVKFVTECNECLDASSDPSCFGPFGWENLLEEVGEQRHSPVGLIECYHDDVGGRHRHGSTEVEAPKCKVDIGVCLD